MRFIWKHNVSLVADTFRVILVVLHSNGSKNEAAPNPPTTTRKNTSPPQRHGHSR